MRKRKPWDMVACEVVEGQFIFGAVTCGIVATYVVTGQDGQEHFVCLRHYREYEEERKRQNATMHKAP